MMHVDLATVVVDDRRDCLAGNELTLPGGPAGPRGPRGPTPELPVTLSGTGGPVPSIAAIRRQLAPPPPPARTSGAENDGEPASDPTSDAPPPPKPPDWPLPAPPDPRRCRPRPLRLASVPRHTDTRWVPDTHEQLPPDATGILAVIDGAPRWQLDPAGTG